MAEKATKTNGSSGSDDGAATEEKEPTFTVAQLLAESRSSLGVSTHVAAGAFHDLAEGHRFTKDEAKERVDEFLKRKAS